MPLAAARRGTAEVSVVLVVLGVGFVALALSYPPQLRFFSIYAAGVALLLLLCGAFAWRARNLAPAELPQRTARRISLAQWILTGLVWSWPASLYAYAATAAVLVGHWPRYGRPDPKDLELLAPHAMVALAFYVSPLAIALWAVWFPLCSRALGRRALRRHAVVFALSVGVLLAVMFLDPGGASEWYAD